MRKWGRGGWLLPLILLVLTVFVLQACAGPPGGNSSTPSVTQVTQSDFPAAMLGKVEGFVYTDGSRTIVSNSASPPASFRPAAGVTVTTPSVTSKSTQPNLAGLGILAKTLVPLNSQVEFFQPARAAVTERNGHFLLSDVVAGSTSILIGQLELPVLVIPGTTVQVGPPTVTREIATQKVLAALPQVVSDPLFCYVLGSLQPVPAGTQLGSALDTATNPLERAQWLYYVDGQPGVKFQKNVTFFLVDAESGALTTLTGSSWPSLNGFGYFKFPEDNEVSPCLIRKPELTNQLPRLAIQEDVPQPRPLAAGLEDCPGARSYLLTVSGSGEGDERANINKIKAIFGTNGIPPLASHISYTSTEYNREDPAGDVKALLKALCLETSPCDLLFVYITSHGSNAGAILETSYITQDSTYTTTRDDGTVVTKIRKGGMPVGRGTLTLGTLDFTGCRACTVVIFGEFCHSGGAIRDGLGFDPQNKSPQRPLGLDGKRLLFICSAEHDKGNPDGNSVAIHDAFDYFKRLVALASVAGFTLDKEALQDGGVFTNAFLNRLRPATSDYFLNLVTATSEAVAKMKTISLIIDQTIKARKQNPCFIVQTESACQRTFQTTATVGTVGQPIPTSGTTGQLVTGTTGTTGTTGQSATGGTEVTTTGSSTSGTGNTTGTGGTTGGTGAVPPDIRPFPPSTSFNHNVGVTRCPQLVDIIAVSNLGTVATTVNITSSNPALVPTPNQITVQPGQAATFSLIFNCSIATSFQATLTYTTGEGVTKTTPVTANVSR